MELKLSVNNLEEECSDDSIEFNTEDINKEILITFNNYLVMFGKIKNNSLHTDLMGFYNYRIGYEC